MNLFESPDMVSLPKGVKAPNGLPFVDWTDDDAIAFGFVNGTLYDLPLGMHSTLLQQLYRKGIVSTANPRQARKLLAPSGRYWMRSRVLSFWSPPSLTELKQVVERFSIPDTAYVELDGWDKDSPIQISDAIDLLSDKDKDSDESLSPEDWKLLAQIQHLMPDAKKALVGSGRDKVGSGKLAKTASNAGFKSGAEYTAASRQSESASILADALLSESPDMFLFPDNSTHAFTHWQDPDALVFGFFDKELFYAFGGTHQDLKVRLQQNGVIPMDNDQSGRAALKPSGRFWTQRRALSFWSVPTYDELKMVIDELGVSEDTLIELDGWNEEIVFTVPEALDSLKNEEQEDRLTPEEWRKMAAVQHLVPDAKKALIGSDRTKVGSGKLASVAAKAGFNSGAEYTAAARQSENVTQFLSSLL